MSYTPLPSGKFCNWFSCEFYWNLNQFHYGTAMKIIYRRFVRTLCSPSLWLHDSHKSFSNSINSLALLLTFTDYRFLVTQQHSTELLSARTTSVQFHGVLNLLPKHRSALTWLSLKLFWQFWKFSKNEKRYSASQQRRSGRGCLLQIKINFPCFPHSYINAIILLLFPFPFYHVTCSMFLHNANGERCESWTGFMVRLSEFQRICTTYFCSAWGWGLACNFSKDFF